MANKRKETAVKVESQKISLSALDPFIVTNIVKNVEKTISGKDFISWGEDNAYPQYLFSLYSDVATLQSVINGTADFISGNNIICNVSKFENQINKNGETMNDLIQKLAVDYLIFGGFAFQVIRNYEGDINEIYWLDFAKLRCNKNNEIIYYSDDWSKSYGRVKYITYPKYKEGDENPTSIVYYKGTKTRSTYPTPIYNAAIIPCEIEKSINQFHINEINNNFLTSKIINFNNGIPDDNLKEEIEKNINEKFSGKDNAGRIMISFNQSNDNATSVTDLSSDNFADRYSSLSKRSSSQIFTAFRATPNLFGLPTETTGFNAQEFAESFKLYNRTTVRPIQNIIVDTFDKVFGITGSVTIEPFSIEEDKENKEENVS